MGFVSAVVNGRKSLAISTIARELASILVRSARIHLLGDDVELKAGWLLNFLRKLWISSKSSFDESTLRDLKRYTESSPIRHEVARVFDKGGQDFYIVAPKAFIRVIRTNSGLSWIGVNGSTFKYSSEELERDIEYHSEYMHDLTRVFDAIIPTVSPADAVVELMGEMRAQYEEMFSSRRARLRLPSGALIQTNKSRHRVTRCWSCHGHLETGTYLECSICGWLVCSCGACGCGKDLEEKSRNQSDDLDSDPIDDKYFPDEDDYEMVPRDAEFDDGDDYDREADEGWYYPS